MIIRSAGPFFLVYAPTQLVAPRAVRMADAMEAISWMTNFVVSFFVMGYLLSGLVGDDVVIVVVAVATAALVAGASTAV